MAGPQLEGAGSHESGVLGSLRCKPQSGHTVDMMVWIRCFNLHMVVMVQMRL